MADINFGQEQIGSSFAGMSRRQKAKYGGDINQFVSAVQKEQAAYPQSANILNQDVAIGNLMMRQEQAGKRKTTSTPAPITSTPSAGPVNTGPRVTDEAIKEMERMGLTNPRDQLDHLNQYMGGEKFTWDDLANRGVVTSNPATAAFNAMSGKIDALDGANLEKASPERALDLIDEQRKHIDASLQRQLQDIENSFQVRSQSQLHTNRQREGGLRAFLGRAGALSSGSGQSMFNAQVMAGQQALSELDMLKQNLKNQAQQARDNQDIELMQETLNMYDKVREQRNKVEQQMFENRLTSRKATLDAQGQQREQQQQDMEFKLNALQALPAEQFDKLDPQALQQMETEAGLPPGYFGLFNDARKAALEAGDTQGAFDNSMKVLELALKMPSGTSFDLPIGPDGQNYTIRGLDVGANKVFQTEDNMGNVFFTTIDPATGKVLSTINAGQVGKNLLQQKSLSGGGSAGLTPEMVTLINQAVPMIGQEGVTAQDVMQLLLAEPVIAGSNAARDAVIEIVTNINKTGVPLESTFTQVKTGSITGATTPVVTYWNPQDPTATPIVAPVEIPNQEAAQGESGIISNYWKNLWSRF